MKGVDLENDSLPSGGESLFFQDQSYVISNEEYRSAVDYDSDEEMWRSRSLFKPRKAVEPKVVVWKRPARRHYKLKYTWLPQPLMHNAANNLYYDKTVKDFYSDARRRNVTNFRKELLQGKERNVYNQERSGLSEQVQYGGLLPLQQQLLSSVLHKGHADRIPSLRMQGYEVQRTKHNDRRSTMIVKRSGSTLSFMQRHASVSSINSPDLSADLKNHRTDEPKPSADDISSIGSAATATSSFYSARSTSKKLLRRMLESDATFDGSADRDGRVIDTDPWHTNAESGLVPPRSNHFMDRSSFKHTPPEADVWRSKFKFSSLSTSPVVDAAILRRTASWF